MKNIQHMENIKLQKIIQAIITDNVFFFLILLVEIFIFPKQKIFMHVICHMKSHAALITFRKRAWF